MPKKVNIIGITVFFILVLFSLGFGEESITITTYYPSPYGVYKTIRLYPGPRSATCQSGDMTYHDGSGGILVGYYFCDNSGAWQSAGGGGGYWNQIGSNLYPTNTTWNVGIGRTDPTYKLDVVSGGNVTARFGTVATDTVLIGGGTGKLSCGTLDPIFNIGGKKYATYVSDFAGGVRIETTGLVKLQLLKARSPKYGYTIDFDNLKESSDLWLFWQASNRNLATTSVLLTSNFEDRTWYKKEGNKLIIFADQKGEVSYRLSAPRIDYRHWPNLAKDQTLVEGMDVSKY
ncbi:MAG: hypothetical protein V1925_03830 [Candidatus Omnitrophota bacterium]